MFLRTIGRRCALALWLCLLAGPWLQGQKFIIGFGAGLSSLSLFGMADQEIRTRNNLIDTKGFPAPALTLHLGLLFANRFALGVEAGDLERGVLYGPIVSNVQQLYFARHTPFLARMTWYTKPYSSVWNLALHVGGGIVSEHQVLRRASVADSGTVTNMQDTYYPFLSSSTALLPGLDFIYRSNVHTLIVLSLRQPILFQSPILTYPLISLAIQVELSPIRQGAPAPASPPKTKAREE